jgi:HAD superfamily hydrolase (TIGR01549 family)
MEQQNIKAIIFDFDGVIADTFDFHWNNVLKFTGLKLSREDFKNLHNGNFYEHNNEALKKINWTPYQELIGAEIKTITIKEEMKELIGRLRAKYQLFIITSGTEINVNACIQYNNLTAAFTEILGVESHTSKIEKFKLLLKKYDLKPADCLFVTDTLGDILEAKKVDITTIAVDFGFHDRAVLTEGQPAAIVSNITELQNTIDKIATIKI